MTRPTRSPRVDTARRRGVPAAAGRELDRIAATTEATVQATQQRLRERGEVATTVRVDRR